MINILVINYFCFNYLKHFFFNQKYHFYYCNFEYAYILFKMDILEIALYPKKKLYCNFKAFILISYRVIMLFL